MPWTVVWTMAADRDLDVAYDWEARRGRRHAARFAASVLRSVEHLQAHPEIGTVAEDLDSEGVYRNVIVPPYRLIYRLDTDGHRILIVRLWNGRRSPDDLTLDEP